MAPVLEQSYPVSSCGRRSKFCVLGWQMSRNGIRSLVILLAVMLVIWSAVAIKILHVAGVFNG
ncbi:TPA: hypothetical protein L9Q72_003134 [Klebsiella pneumoniae]|nr:hypothetical protein [Klebsiella pneumoniae]